MDYKEILEGYEPEFDFEEQDYSSHNAGVIIEHTLIFVGVQKEVVSIISPDGDNALPDDSERTEAYQSIVSHFSEWCEENGLAFDSVDADENMVMFTVQEFI